MLENVEKNIIKKGKMKEYKNNHPDIYLLPEKSSQFFDLLHSHKC